jgi:signal transduction histidine kinase
MAPKSGGKSSPPPYSLWDSSRSRIHSVQFYSQDSFLLDQLDQIVRPAIRSGSSVILIPTAAHRDSIFARLRGCGTEFALAVAQERFLLLDAEQTLAKFMVNGQPDPARFSRVLGNRLTRLAAATTGPSRHVVAFGEMVACLVARGQRDAAVALEQLWNQLATRHNFQLLCAYPLHLFSNQEDRESLLKICGEHSHILPPERPAFNLPTEDSVDSILRSRQKARALEADIRERAFNQRDNQPKGVHGDPSAGTVAHQISGPLETIVNTIYLASQQPELSDKTRHCLGIAERELERVSRIVRQSVDAERRSRASTSPITSGDQAAEISHDEAKAVG